MAILSVLYPASKTKTFDHAYFTATHIPLVKDAFKDIGLLGALVLKGERAPDGGLAPFAAMVHFSFADDDALQAAFASPRLPEVMADIANYTKIKPVMTISTRQPPHVAEAVQAESGEA